MMRLPAVPVIGKDALPQAPRKPRRIQRAPRELTFPAESPHTGGPGDPPPGFVGAKNSATEWQPYWGLARIFGEPVPRILRDGPFIGAPGIWEYQEYIPGGLMATNIDFVVLPTNGLARPTAFRIQTEFVHLFPTQHDKYAADIMYRNHVEEGGFSVVDLYDYMYLGDPSGRAIIQLLKAGLGLIEPANPIATGTAQRVPT
jgi:hypothetical protein